jgi:hypothetical protein
MSYDDLLPWRALAQRIPKNVLNPTHRLIIVTLMTYESTEKGAFFKPEHIASELGLTYRAVMDNFHYLGTGQVWRDGVYQACLNPECKAHLGIIKTSYYARAKRAQTYRLNKKAIKDLASMHSGAHTLTSVNSDADLRAPEGNECAPEGSSACTEVQAYKHNKNFIDIKDRHERFSSFLDLLPQYKRYSFNQETNSALDELKRLGTTSEVISAYITAECREIIEPRTRYVNNVLGALIQLERSRLGNG